MKIKNEITDRFSFREELLKKVNRHYHKDYKSLVGFLGMNIYADYNYPLELELKLENLKVNGNITKRLSRKIDFLRALLSPKIHDAQRITRHSYDEAMKSFFAHVNGLDENEVDTPFSRVLKILSSYSTDVCNTDMENIN